MKIKSPSKSTITVLMLVIVGVFCIFYQDILYFVARTGQTIAIEDYKDLVSHEDTEALDKKISEATTYNQNFENGNVFLEKKEDTKETYENLLRQPQNDVMGRIVIKKIDVDIPIYHYSDDVILEKGIGHIENTALPVGTIGTHCLLTGHRGFYGAKLFSDLDKLETGDEFSIEVMNRKFSYRVDDVKVIEPSETDKIETDKNYNYITLITCTPYGVNSHRLLVRGVLINTQIIDKQPIANTVDEKEKNTKYPLKKMVTNSLIGICLLGAIAFAAKKRKKR